MTFHKDFQQDDFALFRLPRGFSVDRDELERRYHEIQTRVHPDRHAGSSEADRRVAMQWATRVNEAYKNLREPLARARYLLKLAGIDVDKSGMMPPEFLMQQLEWREAVEEARTAADITELEHLHGRLSHEMERQYDELGAQFAARAGEDQSHYAPIADRVRRLMFQEKLLFEIDDALASVEA